jgi:glutamate-ammonia-ligase adenylyltransferase
VALARLAEAGLLPAADAARLIHAERVWRTVQGMLRITVGPAPKADLAEVSAAALLRAVAATGEKVVDLCGLGASLDAIARDVRALFQREIGEITT